MNIPPALIAASLSLGGYPDPPESWQKATKNEFFQMILVSALVYQSSHVSSLTCVIIGILIVHIIWLLRDYENYTKIKKQNEVLEKVNKQIKKEKENENI